MNRSLQVAALVLCAVVALGAGYARFTAASPVAAAVASSVPSAPASVPSAAPPAASAPATSPELERLEQRRVLYETVAALVHASDFEGARKLLDEDQARYGEDLAPQWRDLEQGYRLIADCLERPRDPKPRIRAQAFARVTDAPALVPKLRTACGL